jgi:hypothetical protein
MNEDLPLFSVSPDWNSGVKESREWLTDVVPSRAGSEQRTALRGKPRRIVTYTVFQTDAQEAGLVDALLYAEGEDGWLVPLWMESTRLLVGVSAGATTLALASGERGFEQGGMVLLWRSPLDWELGEIAGFGSFSLSLTDSLGSSWPAGTEVVPVKAGMLSQGLQVDRPSDRLSMIEVTFTLEVL